jgi:serine/threonine-protein kinase HipA
LSETLVLNTARETVTLFHEAWQKEKDNLPLNAAVVEAVEKHLRTVPIA